MTYLQKTQALRRKLEMVADTHLRAGNRHGWDTHIAQAHFVDDIIAQHLGLDYKGTERNA